jgi:hypothetical protein
VLSSAELSAGVAVFSWRRRQVSGSNRYRDVFKEAARAARQAVRWEGFGEFGGDNTADGVVGDEGGARNGKKSMGRPSGVALNDRVTVMVAV